MCLVMAEGIALKAPKIQRYTRQLDEVDWPWLQDLIDGTIEGETKDEDNEESADDSDGESEVDDSDDSEADNGKVIEGPNRVKPKSKYLLDLIAGRPVFGHPSESGGCSVVIKPARRSRPADGEHGQRAFVFRFGIRLLSRRDHW